MTEPADNALLVATRRGDSAAAAALYARFAPRLTALARARLRDHSAADDAVQGAFLRLLSVGPSALAEVRDCAAYLCRMVHHTALNHARSESRRRRHELRPVAIAPSPTPENERITEAVDALPPEQRDVVLLRHIAGLSFDQTAWCLDIPRGTAASRYRLAIVSLRRKVDAAASVDARQETTRVQ